MGWQTLVRFHALVGPRFFAGLALRLVPIVLLELAALLALRLFFVRVYVESGGSAPAQPAAEYPLAAIGTALLAVLMVRLAAGYLVSRSVYDRILGEQQRFASELFANYLGQPWHAQADTSRSEQRQTLLATLAVLSTQMLIPLVQLFVDATVALAVALVLLTQEPLATLVLAGWLGLWFAVQTAATARASRRAGTARWNALNRMRMIVDAALGDPRLTKLSASEAEFGAPFRDEARLHAHAIARESALAQIPVFARELVLATSFCLLVAVLAWQGRGAVGLVGAAALFAAASVRVLPAFQRSVTFVQKLNGYADDLRRIDADRRIEIERLDREAVPGPLIRENLQLRDVAFRYAGAAAPLLEDIDLTVARGERLLVTGPSGGGKSTLILLMCGLLAPERGSVEIDGVPGDILARIRQGRVALVPQDPFVADLTLIENIALPAPPESIDRDRAAALLARLRIDRALEERAGEHGRRLSGGERQRLAVLRAIQRRPELLILDEATSQLDVETEALVYRCIAEECPDATILAIAHRPPPSGLFDRRILLENGRITLLDAREAAPA